MSPSSSTSASEALRYVAVALGAALLLVLLVSGLSLVGMQGGYARWQDAAILAQMERRVATTDRADILLVGDSTLGHAVDARAWTAALGQKVVALPLTGSYGYEGSLNMVRRALRRFRPQTVIVFQTPNMMTRAISWSGLLYTAERPGDVAGAPLKEVLGPLATWDIPMAMLENAVLGAKDKGDLDTGGYVAQGPRRSSVAAAPGGSADDIVLPFPVDRLDVDLINRDKVRFLAKIGDLCRKDGLTCLYAHGPFVDPECRAAAPYITTVNRLIEQAGLRPVAGTPVCMARTQVGDAPDHVDPRFKPEFSAVYRQLVQGALRPAPT